MRMEFELNHAQMRGFEQVLDVTLRPEETMESIVPDACPDILRVVETDGKVLIDRKEAMSGRVEVSGSFQLSVIYVPDGEKGVRHMEVTLPFTCSAESREIEPNSEVVVSARLCRADTRAINPRKVLVRAEAAIDVMAYAPVERAVAVQVEESQETVEQLVETKEVYLTLCVQEKPFTISDEINLSAGKPAAVELLKHRIRILQGESKVIGNKLIFKGSVNVELLYRGEDDGLYTAGGELPFSQIVEVSGAAEEAENQIFISMQTVDCALSASGEGRIVEVDLEAALQVMVSELRTMEILTDAYSIAQPLEAEWKSCPVELRLDRGSRNQTAREVWELAETVREVLDCRMAVSQITQVREGERLLLNAQLEVQLLFFDEQGELYSRQRTLTVPCPLELPEECRCLCRCEQVGDSYAAPAVGGVEIRASLDFWYCALSRQLLTNLSSLRSGEEEEEEEHPSLVLRMLEQGERLWDVAKAYRTTIPDIVRANNLESESDGVGKLLLIPRRR